MKINAKAFKSSGMNNWCFLRVVIREHQVIYFEHIVQNRCEI